MEDLEHIVVMYYQDECRELHKIVDTIIHKLGGVDEITDYYSIADEVFNDVLIRWDMVQDFRGLLWCALSNKFKTEFTRLNRYKRQADKQAVSIDVVIDDNKHTLADILSDDSSIDDSILNDSLADDTRYKKYFDGLSKRQRAFAILLSEGYKRCDIMKKLNLTPSEYSNDLSALRATRNTRHLPR